MQKTGETVSVPLLDEAHELLLKYGDQFPEISSQRANTNIQVIARSCGIDKHVTFHTSRHCFLA